MSIGRWMDTEIWAHIYNGILLSHKNECIWVSADEVDEPRAYSTEWSKSERERQISYINAYIWNLEKYYWWTDFQGRNEDADIEQTCRHSGGRRKWDEYIETYITMCKTASQWEFAVWHRELKTGVLWQPRGVRGGRRWEWGSRGRGHMYTCGWFLLYRRNQHNIVKQLSSN